MMTWHDFVMQLLLIPAPAAILTPIQTSRWAWYSCRICYGSVFPWVDRLGARATLKLLQDADHSFHVPARTGRKDAEVRAEMLDALATWIEQAIRP